MRAAICGFALWSASLVCVAQSKHYLIEETTILTGSRSQFESAQKEYCAAVVRGGAPSCTVLSPTTFSQANRYLTLLSFGSFAHYDQGTYTSKGLTPEQARDLNSRRGPTISSNVESGILLRYPDKPGRDDASPIVLVTEIQVFPGKADGFVQLIKNQAIAARSARVRPKIEIYQTEANGDPDRLLMLQHLAKFADLDTANPLWSTLPKDRRAAFDNAFARDVRSSYVTIIRYRQDLSASDLDLK